MFKLLKTQLVHCMLAFIVLAAWSANATTVLTTDADSTTVFVNPGMNVYTFMNPSAFLATDFRATLISSPPPAIARGSGGAPFPSTSLETPVATGGFEQVTFTLSDKAAGVPGGEEYVMSFPNWPNGTEFDVSFSLANGNSIGPTVVKADPTIYGYGSITATPEPRTSLLLAGFLVLFFGYKFFARGSSII
jgi:hypothetical protein